MAKQKLEDQREGDGQALMPVEPRQAFGNRVKHKSQRTEMRWLSHVYRIVGMSGIAAAGKALLTSSADGRTFVITLIFREHH